MKTFNFSTEFDALSTYLRSFAYKLTNDHHLSEDLYQDMAVLAYRHQHKFESGTNLRAWLCTIMKNIFINNFRKKKKRNIVQLSHDNSYLLDSNERHSTHNSGESNLVMEELYSVIDSLNEDLKEPFLMYYLGHKYEEISLTLDKPLGTIKSKIFSARKELKNKIKTQYNIHQSTQLASI